MQKDGLKELVEDEVLNIVCEQTGPDLFGERVVFPDVPIKREVNKTKEDVRCFFISDLHMDSGSFNKEHYTNFINWLCVDLTSLSPCLGLFLL